ncbi:cytochrome c oxidase subunit 3 (plasmid) [Rhodococcus sp. ZPP]|uniref:cytochrome c oxidase subunit 3 n=1 Tax=Rhodococcus sp. ZPP TaxID=2749906 RepID=UPI001AD87D06|nr:cytochrome c oxidase subunit 3 [Rhodococcus sp. ZPP]QTJ70725.1 cytochrome c oxidase subunit 3 [Rhodococcus sp. ZPP]
MSAITASTRRGGAVASRVPGEAGLWVFLLLDLLFFASIFGTFMVERSNEPEVFDASRANLEIAWGAANTVILLTSSLAMAFAVRCVHNGALVQGRRFVAAAAGLGVWFLLNKGLEWGAEIRAGHVPTENKFFLMYFTSAGIHLLHVFIGLSVLAYLYAAITRDLRRGKGASPVLQRNTEAGGVYWHLVDMLWVVLFALLYLTV